MKKRNKKELKQKKIKIKEAKSKKIKIQEIKSDESQLEEALEEDNQFHDSANLPSQTGSFLSTLSKTNVPQQPANLEEDFEINSSARTEPENIRRDYAPVFNAPKYAPATPREQKFRDYENPVEPTTLRPVNPRQHLRESEFGNKNLPMRNSQQNDNWNQEERITPEIIENENSLPFENQERKYRKIRL